MKQNYLKILVEDIHSSIVATIGSDGHPKTRVIDMMFYDEKGIYFLTARGKEFYSQLMEQKYIALTATKDKMSISLSGFIQNIGKEKLDQIFEKNPYMQSIYPGETRSALDVFCLYEAEGEYFDISNPKHISRESFTIGKYKEKKTGYFVGVGCIQCKLCYSVCPQKCINVETKPVFIDQNHCLRCGKCAEICPKQVIKKRI